MSLTNSLDGLRHLRAGDEPVAVQGENPPLAHRSQFRHARTRCQCRPVRGRADNQNNVRVGLNKSFRREQDRSLGVVGDVPYPGQFQQVVGVGVAAHGLQWPVKLKEHPLGVLRRSWRGLGEERLRPPRRRGRRLPGNPRSRR